MTVNPLLDFSGLPRYGLIRAEHVGPAIDQLLAENRDLISRLTVEGTAASWDEFAEPLENANERLGRAWGAVVHLHAVDDNAAIRDAYNANLSKVTLYRTQLAQDLGLYEKFKALRASSRSEEHTSELQSLTNLVCRLLLEKKKKKTDERTSLCSKRVDHIMSISCYTAASE